jgi:hypothetical protein
LEDVQQLGRLPEQNGIVENWRAEWYHGKLKSRMV